MASQRRARKMRRDRERAQGERKESHRQEEGRASGMTKVQRVCNICNPRKSTTDGQAQTEELSLGL